MSDYFETMQKFGKERFDAVAAASASLAKEFEAVAEDSQNYSKKSFQDTQAYVQKLMSVKSLDEAVETHSDFVRLARRDFIDHANKLGDIYFNFAKKVLKQGDGAVARISGEGFAKSKAA
jgi:hypothetical protein